MIRAASLFVAPFVALSFAGAAVAHDPPLELAADEAAPAAPVAAPAAAPAAAPDAAAPAAEPDLAAVKAATARYVDLAAAMADGYVRDPMNTCETAESVGASGQLGAMGVHYFRPDLLGVTAPPNPRVTGTGVHTDFSKPAILIYEPQADGTMQLVAVENLVFAKAWKQAGNAEPPTFHGQAWDLMVDDPATPVDEAHMFEAHYDRHVWVWRDNPNGVFAQFNPNVSCAHHGAAPVTADAGAAAEAHKAMGHAPSS